LRTLAALATIALVGCTGTSPTAATPTPVASPTAAVSNSAESKAAEFRIRLDLLLGDRVGKTIALKVLRGGAATQLTVTVGERPVA